MQVDNNLLCRQQLDGGFRGTPTLLVEAIAGVNAQTPRAAYVASWTRQQHFTIDDLDAALNKYDLVRGNCMRGTLHMLTSRQYSLWWPALKPALLRAVKGFCVGFTSRVDATELSGAAVDTLTRNGPMTRKELDSVLTKIFPLARPGELGLSCRLLAPIVQAAGSVSWSKNRPEYVPFTQMSGIALGDPQLGLTDLATSYGRSFGSSDPGDFAYWSGLPMSVVRLVKDTLETSVDSSVRIAEPRRTFVLPEFDNIFFSLKGTTPVLPENVKRRLIFGAAEMKGSLLDQGVVVADWRYTSTSGLQLTPWGDVSRAANAEWARFVEWYETTR